MRLQTSLGHGSRMAGSDRVQGYRWGVEREPVREREQREQKPDGGTVLERLLRGIEPRRGREGSNGDFQNDRSR